MYGTILFCIMLVTASGGKRDEEDERWERKEKEIPAVRYPGAFRDSITHALVPVSNEGLRVIEGAKQLFRRREKAVYEGGWGFVNAGWGILEGSVDKEKKRLFFDGKAFTNNFTSAFFEVRDFARSEVDLNGLYPYFFEQHIRENRYKRSSFSLFDHRQGKVYNNRKSSQFEFSVSAFTHDYLSLLYYLRTRPFAPGDTFSINCFVHGKDHPIFFRVHDREEVEVKSGSYTCVKVEPRLVGEGRNFTQRDKMYLWFTDDEYHVLVKARSKVAMGWINAELVFYERR